MRPASILTAALLLLLAGCSSFPRGAGLQSEVLAAETVAETPAGEILTPEFAISPVTRDTIALYAAWPALGDPPLRWINRVDQPDTRIIAAGDTVVVTIWSTEENGLLTAPGQRFVELPPMRVTSSGRIFLPYLGEVPVAGMAPETARARIEERYFEVSPSSQVQLDLQEGQASSVFLVSGVGRPGAYPLPDQDSTIMEMIATGGGISGGLSNPQIRLQRGNAVYGISAERLMSTPGLDTTLRGGDRIVVDRDTRYFLSLGAARNEARHLFPQDEVSALDALSIIGGLNDARADAQGILVLRRYPAATITGPAAGGPRHQRTIFTIDLTTADGLFSAGEFRIQPGDLVYVTESPLQSTRTIVGLISSAFGLVNQAEAAF